MAIMEFYCCDCKFLFESEPDSTGYEQAPCSKCEQICMTSEFEGKASSKPESSRPVVVAEFFDEEAAEPLIERLEKAGLEIQITLPDVTEGDFFVGGVSENVCVMVESKDSEIARQIIESMESGSEPDSEDEETDIEEE